MGNVYSGSTGPSVALSNVLSTIGRVNIAVNASTTYTSGTVVLSAGANITLGTNGQTITISGNAAAAAQTNQSLGLYGLSQTTGGASSTTLDARTLSINAYGALSVGFNAGSIQLSVPNVVAQSSVTFGNANGVSFGLAGSTVTGSVAAQTAQTQNVAVLSASNSVFTSGTIVLSGGNGITVGTGAQTIYISGPGPVSRYIHNREALGLINSSAVVVNSATVVYMPLLEALSFTRMDLLLSIATGSSAAANTAAIAYSYIVQIHTQNASTLTPLIGGANSSTISWASNTGAATNVTGARHISMALATSLSAGDYWVALNLSTTSGLSVGTATTALNATMSAIFAPMANNATANAWYEFGSAANISSSNLVWPLQGVISSQLSATSQTLQASQITQTGTALARAAAVLIFRAVN